MADYEKRLQRLEEQATIVRRPRGPADGGGTETVG